MITFRKSILPATRNIIFYALLFLVSLSFNSCTDTSTKITDLRVQSSEIPLTVEDKQPLFSWQMESEVTGKKQNAFQIVVTSEQGNKIVWDSGKINSGLSHDILYEGNSLEPESSYTWDLTVWDETGKSYNEASRFETGIMNPDIVAWDGAVFIGSNELTLDAASNILFEINTGFQIKEGSKAASIVLGADDFRFSSSFLNIENIEGENYVRFEMDISGVGTETGAVLNVYRVGYGKKDSRVVPYKIISVAEFPETNINELITAANKHDLHNLSIYVETGDITVRIDGTTVTTSSPSQTSGIVNQWQRGPRGITISNYSTGNNFNTFPNLNSVGFAANPGDEVVFSDYRILNRGQSDPGNNVLFGAKSGATTAIFSDLDGITVSDDGSIITVENNTSETIVGYADPSYGSLTMLRTDFSTESGKTVTKAKMYATSMGSYEMFINGKRMGEDWFAPGMTQFRETLGYYAYDVTEMINEGTNSIGALLMGGFYTGYMTFTPGNFNFFGDTEALLARLVISYSDGTHETIVTNPETWKIYKDGPVRYGSFFQGERYDANKEANVSVNGDVNGWATNGYDDSEWIMPEIIQQREWIDFDIRARYDQPVRAAEVLPAVRVMDVNSEDGQTYTYDMGVNMVGVPSVKIPAGWLSPGDVVIFRYGEQLYPGFENDEQEYIDLYGHSGSGRGIAGRILTETYRAALATDFFIASGSDEVNIQPRTTHRGYQYIQITIPGSREAIPLENVKGVALSSDQLPTGTYNAVTSDEKTGKYVNQLFKNIQRSQLGNFFTIPYDCPQRNERMGWTGDAQAYVRTGTYNTDSRNFFRQWMVALRNDQGTGSETEAAGGIGSTVPTYNHSRAATFADGTTWAGAVCMVPWQLYIQYGDKQIIEENMETMMAWLDGMNYYDFSKEYTYLSSKTTGLSDWLAVDGNSPPELINNAIYIYLMEVTAVMAEAIEENEYAAKLRDRHEKAKSEWNTLYVDPETGRTRNADGTLVHTQSSYAQPLNFNVFSEVYIPNARAYLAELVANPSASNTGETILPPYTITTGFAGTPHVLPSLSRNGFIDEAYNMFTSTQYPSWLYPVTMGATSVWERWNGYEAAFGENNQNRMNSFNHFALGAVGQWMYEYQLGITSDYTNGGAGYKHFIVQPSAGGNFISLTGSYNSNYGVVSSSWTADGKGNMTSYTAVIPANTSATLYLPINVSGNHGATEGASFIKETTHNNIQVAEYELSSGTFNFSISENGVIVNN